MTYVCHPGYWLSFCVRKLLVSFVSIWIIDESQMNRNVRKRTFGRAPSVNSPQTARILTERILDSQGSKTFLNHYENTPIQLYWKFYHQNNENFQIKNSDIFHISAQNIDCGYSLEPPRRRGSNEYPQSMFWAEIRKIMYTPVNPSFTIKKWGLRGSKLYRYVFVMTWTARTLIRLRTCSGWFEFIRKTCLFKYMYTVNFTT